MGTPACVSKILGSPHVGTRPHLFHLPIPNPNPNPCPNPNPTPNPAPILLSLQFFS